MEGWRSRDWDSGGRLLPSHVILSKSFNPVGINFLIFK